MSEQNSVGSMSQAIKVAQDAALAAITSAADLVSLRALSAELNKKDSTLNSFKSDMGKLSSVEDKRSIGQLLNAASTQIAAALEQKDVKKLQKAIQLHFENTIKRVVPA